MNEISPGTIVNTATKLAPNLVARVEELVQRNAQILSRVEHMAQDPRMDFNELQQYLTGIFHSMDDIQHIKGADNIADQVKDDVRIFIQHLQVAGQNPYSKPAIQQVLPQFVQALRNKLQRVHSQP